jgi:hypothetical protein
MSIQPIASSDAYYAASNSTTSAPAAKSTQHTPQDTVQLSPQAQASLDKDHDGDSH